MTCTYSSNLGGMPAGVSTEGSGAAPLAAAKKYGSKIAGKKVGLVMSGGNIDMKTLTRVLAGPTGPALQQ